MAWIKKGDQATQPIYCKLFDEKYISLEDKINTSGVFSYTFNFEIFLCITQAFPNQKNNKIRRRLVRRGTKYYYLRFMNRTRNFYTNRGLGHWLFSKILKKKWKVKKFSLSIKNLRTTKVNFYT